VRNGLLFNALVTIAAGSALFLATPARADPLDDLNALRAANGLPAGIVERPEWSAACALHMRYLALNGFAGDWHTESPTRPGFTAAGLAAAGSSVLSNAPSFGLETHWEGAPFHFAQLLAPKLSVTGFADGCMYTWPGYLRPEPLDLRLFTYPGDGTLGTTSPYLYVFGFGGGTTGGTLSEATLTGPGGAVGVLVVDNHTPGVAGLLPPGGILIPDAPLERNADYAAQVTFTSDAGVRAIRRWRFRAGTAPGGADEPTGEAPPRELAPTEALPTARTPSLKLALSATRGGRARATLTASGNAVGRRVRVRFQRLGCRICRPSTRTLTLTKTPRRIDTARRPVRVTVTLPGFWSGEIPYRPLTLVSSLS
jgi:hypothetical protein